MRHRACFAVRAALLPALLGACVTDATRPPRPQPPPSPATLQQLGYADVVQFGTELARQQGYDVEFLEAVPVGRNLWRVRFGLPQKGDRRFLELEFDAATRMLVRSVEIEEVARDVLPTRPLGTLTDAGTVGTPGRGPVR